MMAGILEIGTKKFGRHMLDLVIERASAMPSFAPVRAGFNYLNLRRSHLPDLASYEIDDFFGISLDYRQEGKSSDFMRLAERLRGHMISAICCMDIAESRQPFDLEEDADLQLWYGYGFLGEMLGLSVGSVARATHNLDVRIELFRDFLKVLGLNSVLRVVLSEGETDLDICGANWLDLKAIRRSEAPDMRRRGIKFIDKGRTNLKGRDFSDLTLYCFDLHELPQRIQIVLNQLGVNDSVVRSSLTFGCSQANYPAVREVLGNALLSSWGIRFTAISKYNIDSLNEAIAENENFLFRAFTLNQPDIGEVDVDLYYSRGAFSLHFYCEYKNNEQAVALNKLIIDLADGEDIIDHEII